jgi:hypothetical protein
LTVGLIETAEDECGTRSHHADKTLHILKEDVAVDIGKDNIELRGITIENCGIATEDVESVVYAVDDGIMAGVIGTPLVDIVTYARGCT